MERLTPSYLWLASLTFDKVCVWYVVWTMSCVFSFPFNQTIYYNDTYKADTQVTGGSKQLIPSLLTEIH